MKTLRLLLLTGIFCFLATSFSTSSVTVKEPLVLGSILLIRDEEGLYTVRYDGNVPQCFMKIFVEELFKEAEFKCDSFDYVGYFQQLEEAIKEHERKQELFKKTNRL
jgi:hypothetical protein